MSTVLVALAIGSVIGLVLGAIGGGGGVLTVPALVYLLHEPPRSAAAASLVIVGFAALVALPQHVRAGHVRILAGLVFGMVGTIAAVGGTLVARGLDEQVLLAAFAVLIATAAALMLRDARRSRVDPDVAAPKLGTNQEGADGASSATAGPPGGAVLATPRVGAPEVPSEPIDASRTRTAHAALVVGGGLLVGLVTGVFGVGGGFLAVPVLLLVMRWPMRVAVGTSLLVIVINSAAALVAHGVDAPFDWAVIVPVAIAAAVCTVLGKLLGDRLSGPRLTVSFASLLILLALYTGVRSVVEMLG